MFVRRNALLQASQSDAMLARDLLAATAGELRHARNHTLLLIKSAQERVAAFLLEMWQRMSDGTAFELPMCRRDIADHLGLTMAGITGKLVAELATGQSTTVDLAPFRPDRF